MHFDKWIVYEHMLRSRLFEEAVIKQWNDGYISGEMHLSIGEEGIVAGTVLQLQEDDAMALDHRGTSPMVMRGIKMHLLMNEFLGHKDGLCAGQGGHMHLFSPENLIASSGIVGASGPGAAGFALAAKHLRPGSISLAFFGEGAMNQGMLMESMNLAVALQLPVVFICKDNDWSITTVSNSVTGGDVTTRAKSFGVPVFKVNGVEVEAVWDIASRAFIHTREEGAPSFIHATCAHPEGHFLGDPLLRITRHPVKEMKEMAAPLFKSIIQGKGAAISQRKESMVSLTSWLNRARKEQKFTKVDPVHSLREKLQSDSDRLKSLENKIREQIREVVRIADTLNKKTG